ncbi:MAG: 2Fe-2S iron-sulfur cluster-binding protein [Candidatus Tenebribacter burtonii]|jgi:carbon-monoxide dehydrogenase small subunit|nr:2Fe-2S iron-sulfur cluster-binding protein [Candidatus Tenebribacter burtonii]
MKVNLDINNRIYKTYIDADEALLSVLRKLGYKSVKKGCDTGACGVCSVLIDGKPTLSCQFLAARAEGHKITTVEGLGKDADEIVDAIVSEGADQCGYCGPSLVLTTYAMKKELKDPTIEKIKHYLAGNLCRCSGFEGQLRGIKRYMGVK